MEQRAITKILLDLILSIDPGNLSVPELFEAVQPILARLSEEVHVASMVTHIHTEPNVYTPNGLDKQRRIDFYPEAAPLEEALVMSYDKLRNTRSTTTVLPRKGHHWSDEEREVIRAVGSLLYAYVSRISMIEIQQKIALTDQLTGLNNTPGAIHFCERVRRQYSLADYASCFMNLKNLKFINRQLDNHSGDAAMRQYAMTLNGMLDPKREQLARLGGDNFFALVRKDHLEAFLDAAKAMPVDVEFQGRSHTMTVGAWIGVYNADGDEKPRDLLDYASFAYERAKRSKTTVAYFTPAMMESSMHARQISQILPRAMDNRELVPFYQPKVSMHTGDLYGCEALVRWRRDGEIVPPSGFLPVAENSDLITDLDLYMLDAVCADIRSWLDAGLEPVCVSINYSQRDFYRATLVEETLETLRKYDIDGKYLEIEITESSFFENFDALERFVDIMHQNGVRVSLDDFGTGYSSLTLFERLSLDTVKLDRSFFMNMGEKVEKGRLVLHSIADMLNQLNKLTVSEGVETSAQLALVEEIGCDIVQGFYFDRPLPRDVFTDRLRRKHYDVEPHPDEESKDE